MFFVSSINHFYKYFHLSNLMDFGLLIINIHFLTELQFTILCGMSLMWIHKQGYRKSIWTCTLLLMSILYYVNISFLHSILGYSAVISDNFQRIKFWFYYVVYIKSYSYAELHKKFLWQIVSRKTFDSVIVFFSILFI